jgi:hypothetical protein
MRRLLLVAAVAALIALAGGCLPNDDSSAGSSTGDAPSTGDRGAPLIPAAPLRALAEALPPIDGAAAVRVRIPRSPDWLAADDDFVYVKLDGGAVVRLDPVTAEPLGQVELSRELCQGIGVGYGSVWTCIGSDVVRIDPGTDTVTERIPVNKASAQSHLATGFEAVWVLVGDGSDLVAIDPSTNEASREIPLGVRGTDVAVGSEHVWVMSAYDGAVVRIDPHSMTVNGRIPIEGPNCILVSDGLWVGAVSKVLRIDEQSLMVTQEIGSPAGRNCGLTLLGSDLLIRKADPFLVHIDTDAESEVQRLNEDVRSSGDILVAFDAIWTTAYDDVALFRIPLNRVFDTTAGHGG